MKKFSYAVECIPTDNGLEFTNRLNSKGTKWQIPFAHTLAELGIHRPYTPRCSGEVERSRRKDHAYFRALHRFFSFEDLKEQLTVWDRKYNDFPMRPLRWRPPKEVIFSRL